MIYWLKKYWYVVAGLALTLLGVVAWGLKDYISTLRSKLRVNNATNEVMRAIDQAAPTAAALDALADAEQNAVELSDALLEQETQNDATDKTESDADVTRDLAKRGLK